MDLELRTVLLVVGVVVIAAILLHGLLSIRQSNEPVDISALKLDETDEDGNVIRDVSGFDRHGVGVARVVSADDTLMTPSSPEAQLSQEVGEDAPCIDSASINFDVALDDENNSSASAEPAINEKPTPMFASPIAKEKEDFLAVKHVAESAEEKEPQNIEIDEPEIGKIDFTDVALGSVTTEKNIFSDDIANDAKSKTNQSDNKDGQPMDVLILNVIAEDNNDLDGATLLPVLLTLGFKFGDMNIFHRHVDAAGQGAVLFSLANMVQPGHFDIDNMEQFTTQGISLFMTLPHKNGNMETFNIMLNAAAKIAEEFNGQVLDGDRSTLTKQSTQQYVQRIRELERKMLLVK